MADPIPLEPLLLFSIGLLGGAHCIGMCGPLVMIYSRNMEGHGSKFVARQHALLNFGRVTIYAVLGAVFGFAGTILGAVPFWGQLNAYVAVVIGISIILFGIKYVTPGLIRLTKIDSILKYLKMPNIGASDLVTNQMIRFIDVTKSPKIYFVGFLHGFLPCPIIIPPLLYIFSIGSIVNGIMIMGLIGLGTFGTMFLLGVSHNFLTISQRMWMMRILGVLLIILGLIPLLHGLKMLGYVDQMIHIGVYQPFNSG